MNPPAAYRACQLSGLSLAQIAALPDKARATVLVATGAIEQHGPHLPVAVDALMGEVWLSLALARLPAETRCYVAPPITIGKSNVHTGFPGTLSISKETLRAQLLALARQLHAWGFRRNLCTSRWSRFRATSRPMTKRPLPTRTIQPTPKARPG